MDKEEVKFFLDKKAQDSAYIDFYNFLVRADKSRQHVLIPRWIEEMLTLNKDK